MEKLTYDSDEFDDDDSDPIYDIPEENNETLDEEEDLYSTVGAHSHRDAVIDGYVQQKYEIGSKGKNPGQFGGWIQHYAVDHAGEKIYTCDSFNKRIQVLDFPSGRYIHSFTTNMGTFNFQARGIAVLRDGSICVNCVGFDGTSRIGIFTPEGQVVRYFGERMIGYSMAMCVDNMDRISVLDKRKMKVMTFSRNGERLEVFAIPITQDCLRICANSQGHLILSDHLNNCLHVVDQVGTTVKRIRPQFGTGINFHYPGNVAVDGDDNFMVCDVGHHRVMKFDKEGIFKANILTKREHHIWMPHDTFITKQGHVVLSEVGSSFLKGFQFAPSGY